MAGGSIACVTPFSVAEADGERASDSNGGVHAPDAIGVECEETGPARERGRAKEDMGQPVMAFMAYAPILLDRKVGSDE